MLHALNKNDCQEEPLKRAMVDFGNLSKKRLADFVTKLMMQFFHKLKLMAEFLDADRKERLKREDFRQDLTVIRNIKVLNDYAVRDVSLIQEYSRTRAYWQRLTLLDYLCWRGRVVRTLDE